MFTGTSIPYSKVTSIHYQTLSKKDTAWNTDVNNLSVRSLQVLLLLFLDKRDAFANKNEEFYNPSINKILATTMECLTNFLWLNYRLELKKYFYRKHSNVIWEFLTTKSGLWTDIRSSTDNTLHSSGRAVEKSGIFLQIGKESEASNGDLMCYVFSLEDAVAHRSVTDPSSILTIKKQGLDD